LADEELMKEKLPLSSTVTARLTKAVAEPGRKPRKTPVLSSLTRRAKEPPLPSEPK